MFVEPDETIFGEIRSGKLHCYASRAHVFDIKDGIIHFATGFGHEAVKKEISYENSTYKGDVRLTDKQLIAKFPDTLAEIWPHTRHFGLDFKALIDHLNVRPDPWILDIGTGPCWSSRLLAQRCENVIVLDVNEANFYGLKTSDIMFKEYDVYFERVLESMTCLPFRDESMDYVTFNASFHHTPDHYQTLKECSRVLKPGGQIAMVNEEFTSFRHMLQRKGESEKAVLTTAFLTPISKRRPNSSASKSNILSPIMCARNSEYPVLLQCLRDVQHYSNN